ncbi:MAG: hypothetical protein IPK19_26425 [Chloroflexi bacterium]|nr:hypothetical protein [Chloroflexota bacterium]
MYRLTPPAASLQPFIECYWSIDHDAPAPVQQHLVVDGRTDILFTFGQSYQYTDLLNRDSVQSSRRPHYSGLRDYPMHVRQMRAAGWQAFVSESAASRLSSRSHSMISPISPSSWMPSSTGTLTSWKRGFMTQGPILISRRRCSTPSFYAV